MGRVKCLLAFVIILQTSIGGGADQPPAFVKSGDDEANRMYNEIIDTFNLRSVIKEQMPAEGRGKFFDLNDFDCKYR